jgi:hypothetical protein
VTKITRSEFADLLDCAHDLADRSGQVILPHFRKALQVENKAEVGKFDPESPQTQLSQSRRGG